MIDVQATAIAALPLFTEALLSDCAASIPFFPSSAGESLPCNLKQITVCLKRGMTGNRSAVHFLSMVGIGKSHPPPTTPIFVSRGGMGLRAKGHDSARVAHALIQQEVLQIIS